MVVLASSPVSLVNSVATANDLASHAVLVIILKVIVGVLRKLEVGRRQRIGIGDHAIVGVRAEHEFQSTGKPVVFVGILVDVVMGSRFDPLGVVMALLLNSFEITEVAVGLFAAVVLVPAAWDECHRIAADLLL